MATKTTGEVIIAGDQRGAVFQGVNHDRITNAIRYLSYAKCYYPNELAGEIAVFTKALLKHKAAWSMEDDGFKQALYEFEAHFQNFLNNHPETKQDVNRLSPKEMVDGINKDLVDEARARREAVLKTSKRVVDSLKQQHLQLNTLEIEGLEKEVEAAIDSSITGATTAQELQQSVEERVAPIVLAKTPTGDREEVIQAIRGALRENPKEIQQVFFSDQKSQEEVLQHVVNTLLPNKRALAAITTNLPIYPDETREDFFVRTREVAQTAMVLSSDFSETPAAGGGPGGLISAILEAGGNRAAIVAFEKLTEQAKNAVSLTVVSRAVEAATEKAGGALVPMFKGIIQQGGGQLGAPKQSFEQAASLVGDVLNPLLGKTFARLDELEALNRSLPPGNKIVPDKTGVTAFIESLSKTRQGEGAAATVLLVAAGTQFSGGVTFRLQHSENPFAPAAWTIQFATDSVIGRLVNRTVKGEAARGFFGKILGLFGFRVVAPAAAGAAGGVAGKAATGGLIKIFGFFAGILSGGWGWVISIAGGLFAAPLFNKAKEWFGNLLSGRVSKLKPVIEALEQTVGGQGGGRGAQEEQKRTDFMIALIVGVPIIILITASMFQITTQNSALFVASQETPPDFSGESNPSPDLSLVASECKGQDLPPPSADGVKTTQIGGRTYAFPIAPYDRTYYTCGHHDGLQATDMGINGVETGEPHVGLAVVAYTDGVIETTELNDPKGGKYVILRGEKNSYYYAHNCALYVKRGDRVTAGQVIAATGNTGSAAGTPEHLHFAITAAGGDFYNGGDACPAKDFKEKFGISKCGAEPLCPPKPPKK